MDRGLQHCTGGSDQNHPKEKAMQEGKVVVWGNLANSGEKKRSKRQRRRERYMQLNSEFQRTVKRDKKVFLSEQRKEIEENNKMEGVEISLRKLKIPRENLMQRWSQ